MHEPKPVFAHPTYAFYLALGEESPSLEIFFLQKKGDISGTSIRKDGYDQPWALGWRIEGLEFYLSSIKPS